MISRDGEVHEMEQHHRTRSDQTVICLVTAFRTEIGGRPCTFYRMRDVTRERRAEQGLRESEEKFSKAFRASPDSITIATIAEGRIIDGNEGFTRLHGWTREEAVGRTSIELQLWGDLTMRRQVLDLLLEGKPVMVPISRLGVDL
jgi:PAS domain-containing protein